MNQLNRTRVGRSSDAERRGCGQLQLVPWVDAGLLEMSFCVLLHSLLGISGLLNCS